MAKQMSDKELEAEGRRFLEDAGEDPNEFIARRERDAERRELMRRRASRMPPQDVFGSRRFGIKERGSC